MVAGAVGQDRHRLDGHRPPLGALAHHARVRGIGPRAHRGVEPSRPGPALPGRRHGPAVPAHAHDARAPISWRVGGSKTVECPYTGETLHAVPALYPDVALLHVQRADRFGNCQIDGYPHMDADIAFASADRAGDRGGDRARGGDPPASRPHRDSRLRRGRARARSVGLVSARVLRPLRLRAGPLQRVRGGHPGRRRPRRGALPRALCLRAVRPRRLSRALLRGHARRGGGARPGADARERDPGGRHRERAPGGDGRAGAGRQSNRLHRRRRAR